MTDQTIQLTITLDQLKTLIREAVQEALLDLSVNDLSSEPNFAPEIAERLERYKHERPKTVSVDEVVKELGLDA